MKRRWLEVTLLVVLTVAMTVSGLGALRAINSPPPTIVIIWTPA